MDLGCTTCCALVARLVVVQQIHMKSTSVEFGLNTPHSLSSFYAVRTTSRCIRWLATFIFYSSSFSVNNWNSNANNGTSNSATTQCSAGRNVRSLLVVCLTYDWFCVR